MSQYQWYQDDISLSDEHYPIMYASQCGVYRCDVHVQNTDMKQFTFTVQGAVVSDLYTVLILLILSTIHVDVENDARSVSPDCENLYV